METKAKDSFQLIPIEKLQTSHNHRKNFDEKFMAELTNSVRSKGILEPLLVRSVNAHFEIVAGEQRYRAAKEAKLKQVPAIIKALTDEEALEIQVIENVLRKDVDPFEEAAGYQKLMDKGKYNVKLLSEKIGKSEVYIYARLKLNKLIEPLKKLYDSNWLQLGHVMLASKYNKETQEKILIAMQWSDHRDDWDELPAKVPDKQKAESAPSVGDLTKWLNDNAVFDLSKVKFDITDKLLYKQAGNCISCSKNTSNDLSLFEGAKKNLCTDRKCRETKLSLWLQKTFNELKEKNPEVVAITDSTRPSPLTGFGEIYTTNKYKEYPSKTVTKGSCSDTKQTLFVDSPYSNSKDQIGKISYQCFNPNCKVHSHSYERSSATNSTQSKAHRDYVAERKLIMLELTNARTEILIETIKAFKGIDKDFVIEILDKLNLYSMDKEPFNAIPEMKDYAKGSSYHIPINKINPAKHNLEMLIKLLFADVINYYTRFSHYNQYENFKTKNKKDDRLMKWAMKLLGQKKINEITTKHKIERKKKKGVKKSKGKTVKSKSKKRAA